MATTQQRQVVGAAVLVLFSLGLAQVVTDLDYIRLSEGERDSSWNTADESGWFNVFFEQPDAVIAPSSRTRASRVASVAGALDGERSEDRAAATAEERMPLKSVPTPSWVVQVGSFESLSRARLLEEKLRTKGHRVYVEKPYASGLHRVLIGPYSTQGEAKRAKVALIDSGTPGWVSPR